jgi:hypothetical protein
MSHVDVIIPCYNYGRYLPGCVRSVLDQAGVHVRVLVIDDASTDGSGQIADEFARTDSRIEVRRHATNHGHIATYNEGFAWASEDYALLLSADDLLTTGALSRATSLLDAHSDVGLAYGGQILFDSDQPPPQDDGYAGPCRIRSGRHFIAGCCQTGGNPIPTPTAVVRTSLWKRLGGYRTDLPHTADMELWLRLAAHADVGVIGASQAFKRMHASNMQHQYLSAGLGDLPHRLAAFEALFLEYGRQLPAGLRQTARATLAEQAFWAASSALDGGDLSASQQCLDFAQQLNPALRQEPHWTRLAWKRLLGPRVWSSVQPLVESWRGLSRRAAAT